VQMPQDRMERVDLPSEVQPAAGCIVTLHGRGVTGEDLVPLAQELRLPSLRFVFPHAPFDFMGPFNGRAWYESPPRTHEGLPESRQLLFQLFEELESEGVEPDRIALMGFSQGAVMSLDAGIRYSKRLAGIVAMSGYLYAPDSLGAEKSAASSELPVLLAHGTYDDVLPIEGSRQALKVLRANGFQARLVEYPMGHQVIPEELEEVRSFLKTVFPGLS
jgi:phospholipase/carboxylesterase